MTLVLSTSSPLASVALFDGEALLAFAEADGRNMGHRLVFGLIDQAMARSGRQRRDVQRIVVDVGPGGFTAVRVGVTLAKTWSHFGAIPLAGVEAFALISTNEPVAIGVRRGQYLLKSPGETPRLVEELPDGVLGHGSAIERPTYPSATRYRPGNAFEREAHLLVPEYAVPPSISQPKKPLSRVGP